MRGSTGFVFTVLQVRPYESRLEVRRLGVLALAAAEQIH